MIKKEIEEHQQNKQLTSAELADLFSNFMGDSLYCCVFEHYLQVVEDDGFPLLQPTGKNFLNPHQGIKHNTFVKSHLTYMIL